MTKPDKGTKAGHGAKARAVPPPATRSRRPVAALPTERTSKASASPNKRPNKQAANHPPGRARAADAKSAGTTSVKQPRRQASNPPAATKQAAATAAPGHRQAVAKSIPLRSTTGKSTASKVAESNIQTAKVSVGSKAKSPAPQQSTVAVKGAPTAQAKGSSRASAAADAKPQGSKAVKSSAATDAGKQPVAKADKSTASHRPAATKKGAGTGAKLAPGEAKSGSERPAARADRPAANKPAAANVQPVRKTAASPGASAAAVGDARGKSQTKSGDAGALTEARLPTAKASRPAAASGARAASSGLSERRHGDEDGEDRSHSHHGGRDDFDEDDDEDLDEDAPRSSIFQRSGQVSVGAQDRPSASPRGAYTAEAASRAFRDDPLLDRRIIEGMLDDKEGFLDDMNGEGFSRDAVVRRAAELGLSEALIRQVKGVAADLAGERPGKRPTPSSLGARTCLQCDRIFFSSGPGNRLCTRCRGGDAGLAQL